MLDTFLLNPLNIAVAILALIVIALLVIVIILNTKLRRFLVRTGNETISDSLQSLSADIGDLKEFRAELEKYLSSVEKRLKKSVQHVHTVRFNPFQGTGAGGNQSFATAILDEEGNGVVISSLYSRDHVSVFGKPIKDYSSTYELSGEEREAVEKVKEKSK